LAEQKRNPMKAKETPKNSKHSPGKTPTTRPARASAHGRKAPVETSGAGIGTPSVAERKATRSRRLRTRTAGSAPVRPPVEVPRDAGTLAANASAVEAIRRWDEQSSYRLYLREATATPLLTPAEEVALALRVKAGDDAARDHMIRANLRLVIKIAREYEDYGLPLLDLISEGNIGLMKAVDRFDLGKGAKLSTYAVWWIKQAIRRALSNQSKSIRLPIHLVQEISRMRKAEAQLEAELERPPTEMELAAKLVVDVADIRRWREAGAVGAVSIDTPLNGDPEAGCVADVLPDENAAMPWTALTEGSNAALIRELLQTLTERERRILRERFALDGGDSRTLEDIGVDFGLTRERIRQIESGAIRKLREKLRQRESIQFAA